MWGVSGSCACRCKWWLCVYGVGDSCVWGICGSCVYGCIRQLCV